MNKTQEIGPDEPIVQSMDESPVTTPITKSANFIVYGLCLGFGLASGFLLAKYTPQTSSATQGASFIKTDKARGSTDSKTFKDSAQGTLEKGGSDGEGTHQLTRDGGPSQTVYLVSSVVDLDEFAGKKVKVYGQTMAAQSVPWLMDVGKIEIQ